MTDLFSQYGRPYSVHPERTQELPFRIRMAAGPSDLLKAVSVRTQAYARHVPGMEKVLKDPEPDDYRSDAVILLAESKTTGEVLGSIRLLTNLQQPLHLEEETELPPVFQGRKLLEAWRLTVFNCEEARMVAPALYKSLYEVSFLAGIEYVLVVARSPVDRLYKAMQFKEALQGRKLALSNTLHLPHGLYYLDVRQADSLWQAAQCPLYPFMACTRHPDIDIDHAAIQRRFQRYPWLARGASSLPKSFCERVSEIR